MTERLWSIKEYPFHPEKLRYHETIFTIGNGYIGTRGSLEEGYEGDNPATFVHGLYNHAEGELVPELVNIPDWTRFNIWIDDTPFKMITESPDPFHPPDGLVLGYERRLHMDTAILKRTVLFRATTGNTVRIVFERFASLDDQHRMVQRIVVTAIDGTPKVTVQAVLDGDVSNQGVNHWEYMKPQHIYDNMIAVHGKTSQSKYTVDVVSKLSPYPSDVQVEDKRISATSVVQLEKDGEATFDRYTTIFANFNSSTAVAPVIDMMDDLDDYDSYLKQHKVAWQAYWETADIQIKGDEIAQLGVRFTTYHVLIATPQQNVDASIGAKTLSGYGYAGHVFWDTELFMMPPLTLTQPHLAKNLLMYRYRRLHGARQKAKDNGFEGAMFPWESTDTGLETTPIWTEPKPPDGRRLRIYTGEIELHISADIAYGILQYWRWTGDDKFMRLYGVEMVLDTAVFWGSRVESTDRGYEITDIIGPDEYHEHVDNNAFTNRMAQWHLGQALDLLDWLENNASDVYHRLVAQLDLSTTRLDKWRDIIDNFYIPFDETKQIHEQFEGFFDLEFIPVEKYQPRVGGIWDYLGHERASASQVLKQADVVMLIALLGDEVGSREILLNNFNTYYPRCDHGSSLSPAMHAWVAARLDLMDIATKMMENAIMIDLEDNQGNVHAGIHGAASGGAWQMIVFGFCGLHLANGQPAIQPNLPKHWESVTFTVLHHGEAHTFVAT